MLDIIIPTKNCVSLLKDCLESLAIQISPVHVIVVDANSKDGTQDIAKQYGADVYIEPPSKVKGSRRAVACNEGLKHCTHEIVAFVDADTIIPDTWSKSIEDFFGTDKHICGETLPRTELNSRAENVAAITTGCTMNENDFSSVIRFASAHGRYFEVDTELESVPGYNSAYIRECVESVGGFSEDVGGAEDFDLCYKLRRKGYRILGINAPPVEHKERQGMLNFSRQMYGYGWSRGRLYQVRHIFTVIHTLPLIVMIVTLILMYIDIRLIIMPEVLLLTIFFIVGFLKMTYVYKIIRRIFVLTIFTLSYGSGYFIGLFEGD